MHRFTGSAFSGGLNNSNDPSLIKNSELQDCLNVRVDNDGSMQKRLGCSKVLTSAESNPITDIEQITAGGGRYNLYATKTNVKKVNGSTGDTLLTGLNGVDYSLFHQWNDRVFYANGIDNIKRTSVGDVYSVYAWLGNSYSASPTPMLRFNGNLGQTYLNDISGETFYHHVVSAGGYIFLHNPGGVSKYTFDLAHISDLSDETIIDLATDGTYLYSIGGAGSAYITKYDLDLNVITTSASLGVAFTAVATNGTNIYACTTTGNTLYKYDMTYNLVASLALSFVPGKMTVNNTLGFMINSGSSHVYLFSLSTLTPTDITITAYFDSFITCNDDYLYYIGTSQKELKKYNLTSASVDSTVIFSKRYFGVFVNMNPIITNWYDHISPYRVAPNVTSVSGNPASATTYYRDTWYDINSGTETSGGMISSICSPSSKKVEVFFDFNSVTQMTKARSQYLTGSGVLVDYVNRYRLYRKEGSNNFKLQGTYPIWWELAQDLSATTTSTLSCSFTIGTTTVVTATGHGQITGQAVTFTTSGTLPSPVTAGTTYYVNVINANTFYICTTFAGAIAGTGKVVTAPGGSAGPHTVSFNQSVVVVSDVKGLNTFTENFYVQIDSEIMRVDNISGANYFVTRAQKNTTATAHISIISPVYLFSIIDNTATGALGTDCPTANGFSENAKYMTHSKERFIYANSKNHPSRVWYSSYNSETLQGDEDLVYVDNWYDAGRNDGDDRGITGLWVYLDNVMVFKEHSIYYLSGDLDTAIEIVFSRDIGCVSQHSIVEWYGGLFFMSRDGLIYLKGQTLINCSKYFIPQTINGINWAKAYLCSGAYLPSASEIWITYPDGVSLTPNRVLVLKTILSDFNTSEGAKCFTISDRPLYSMQLLKDANEDDVIWSGDVSGNLLLENTGNVDIASAIDSYAITKNFGDLPGTKFDYAKKLRRLIVDYEKEGAWNLLVGYNTDGRTCLNTCTITIAIPGVVSVTGHGLATGDEVVFSTTGALPTGITAGTVYYVIYKDANSFNIATSLANALSGTKITTSGSQSGGHTALFCVAIDLTGTGRTYKRININTDKATKYISFRFSNPNANEPWHAFNYTFDFKSQKIRNN